MTSEVSTHIGLGSGTSTDWCQAINCNLAGLLPAEPRAGIHFSEIWIKVHYNDVIMSTMASQIISLTIVYSSVYSSADQRKHQSSASLAIVRGIHQWPVNSPHKGPVTRKIFPFDDAIITTIFIDENTFETGNADHFAGPLSNVSILLVLWCTYDESSRRNGSRLVSPSLWLLIM